MSFEIKGNRFILNEPLVDIEEIFNLAKKLNEIKDDKVIIDMSNNYSLPSTIIGQLSLLKQNGKEVEIIVYDDLLYSLLKDLGLTDMFNILKK